MESYGLDTHIRVRDSHTEIHYSDVTGLDDPHRLLRPASKTCLLLQPLAVAMSRNMRRRSTPPPARKVLASSSQASQNSDYDDDYGGVDDISSGEEDGDEPNVEGAEERDIISSEHTDDLAASRPAFIEDEEPWEGFGMDTEILGTFFEQEMQNGSSFGGSNNEAAQIQKHVRWEFPQESDSETIGSQSGAEWYTDLFMEKDALDHQFCQLIDRDDDTGRFSDDGFYYDDAASDEDASSDQSNPDSDLSGYDSG